MLKQERKMNLTGSLTMMNQRPFSSKHKLGGAGSAAEFALYLRTVFIRNFKNVKTLLFFLFLVCLSGPLSKMKQN